MIWAIGDIQGCYKPFKELLKKIDFNPKKDTLWIAGDLVNRGEQSLEVLEYLYSIRDSIKVVLGNHDIALIAIYLGIKKSNPTLESILKSPNRDKLLKWLMAQPFLQIDYNIGYAMAHAGIAPNFELGAAKHYNDTLQKRLQSKKVKEWLKAMIKKDSPYFDANGSNTDLERYIIGSFTRMRYCYKDGHLDFKQKGSPSKLKSSELFPWFDCPTRVEKELKIIFGHWSTLGFLNRDDILSTDTGCLWGGKLTAVSLPDEKVVSVDCGDGIELV